jgi:hypothetical protein
MNIFLVIFVGFHYPLYHHFTLVTDHAAVSKPMHQISEVSVVMLEYPHIEDNNNPLSGAK